MLLETTCASLTTSINARVYVNGRASDHPSEDGLDLVVTPTDHPLFGHAGLLARVLAPFPDVKIVLSTS